MRSATLFVIALALASIDCGQCTAECTNLATGTGTLTGDVSTATDTTVCSNGVCSTVPTTFELEGDSSFDVVATYTGDVTGTLRITQQGFITLSVTGKSNGFHDGDFYGLLVNASGGTLVSKTSAPVTYTPVVVCSSTCKETTFTF